MARERFEPVMLRVDEIRRAAGDAAFEAGRGHFLRSRVHEFSARHRGLEGVVRTRHWYRAWIGPGPSGLTGRCTCEASHEWPLCEHAVALGLAWIDAQDEDDTIPEPAHNPRGTAGGFEVLADLPRDVLLNQLRRWASEIPDLRHRIEILGTKAPKDRSQAHALRRLILRTLHTRGELDHTAQLSYLQRTASLLDSIEEAAATLPTVELVDLVECALGAIENALELVDDDHGVLGEALGRLQSLHVRACERGVFDPEDLAERLFEWACQSKFGVFEEALVTHARALGEEGLRAYRTLVEAEWADVPHLAVPRPGIRARDWTDREQDVAGLMRLIARRFGTVEEQIEVEARDLSAAYRFATIARLALDAGKSALAIEWVEKGISASQGSADPAILSVGIEAYRRTGLHAEALALAWQAFDRSRDLDAYKELIERSKPLGELDATRAKARKRMEEGLRASRSNPAALSPSDHSPQSELVRILLSEGLVDDAVAQARLTGCSVGLWSELAEAREGERPEEAIGLHIEVVRGLLAERNNDAYRATVRRLERVKRLAQGIERPELFGRLVGELRVEHKAKRNFQAMLDERGW